jgi:threonine synthase
VPSGNFGNLTAGLVAFQMGLPVKRFVAATNINDIVPKYLRTGHYQTAPSIATPANAMDVGDPSNFIRIQELFDRQLANINEHISGVVVENENIFSTIKKVYEQEGYVLDPHGAIGYKALEGTLKEGEHGIFLATAHPAKFPETVEKMIGRAVEQPDRLKAFLNGEKQVESSSSKYDQFKTLIESMAR